jgi:chemotaxis family two-component system response regulator Rcp1
MNDLSYRSGARPEEPARAIEILLVEDNPGDVRLMQEALREGRAPNHLTVVGDGEQAMAFLRREGCWAQAPRPDLVLLDLNLPRKDGREVLREVKDDPGLRRIPVVVMTTSHAEADVMKSYDLHANCYIPKPVDLDEFIAMMRVVEDFWLRIVKLPSR